MFRLKLPPFAIDPYDCGCTECIIRDYVPLRSATEDHIALMLKGKLRNNTSTEFRISAQWSLSDDFRSQVATISSVLVTAEVWNGPTLTWDLTSHLDGQLGRLLDPGTLDDR